MTRPAPGQAPARFGLDQALAFPAVENLVAAPTGRRIAFILEERGVRNIFGAEGPGWAVRKLTAFTEDDGLELTDLAFSADGSALVFVRNPGYGNWPSPEGVAPNPTARAVQPKTEVWTVRFAGGARLIGEGGQPAIAPHGDRVAFIRGGQAMVASLGPAKPTITSFFFARGTTGSLTWSPDGSRIAFVSDRGEHSLLGVYRPGAPSVRWLVPSTDRIASFRWAPDGKRIAFARFGGAGGIPQPRMVRQPFPWELWVADVETGEGRRVWASPATIAGSFPDTQGDVNLGWAAGDRLVFTEALDGWPHLYSIPLGGGEPLLLTPGKFMVEYVTMSPDRRTIVYNANTGPDPADDDRRHLFKVPVDAATPEILTPGTGIEWSPVVTGDGSTIAFYSATARRSPLPTLMPFTGGTPRLLAQDRVPREFAGPSFVEPKKVTFQASDGLTIHGQLFDAGGDGKKPAMVFVHGGPPRQMLLGFHYMTYYTRDYAMNQYLASRGFVVLAVNYRLGIGYGDAFQHPDSAGPDGASEYRDVLAGAKYLQGLPNVDPKRLGIWGGSYGGYLTALALARNSDIFAAGVDLHGVHNWLADLQRSGDFKLNAADVGRRPPDYYQALATAWSSSPVADIDTWRSPVLLIQGDDDRNVHISETIDLAQRLKQKGVRFEELLLPDETHDWLRFKSWLTVTNASARFLTRELSPPSP
jgi:dipeptidyl aminopeptidase/acylaminoacyl peptidase